MITWKDFAVNEWKSIVRSPLAGQTIGMKILWAVAIILIVGEVSGVGFYLPLLLRKEMPGSNPADTINRILWGYFLGDLIVRIILINIPATIIHQYLHCNISRKKIAGYLLVKSLFNFPNAVGIGLWCSFSLSNFGFSAAGLFWFAGILIVLCINTMLILLAASFRRLLISLLFGGIVISIIGVLEYFTIPLLRDTITALFADLSLGNTFAIIIPSFLLAGLIGIVHKKITLFMYLDRLAGSGRKASAKSSQISQISEWRFEWLLISRNKRLRTMMIMMYGFLMPNFLFQFVNGNIDHAKPVPALMTFFLLSMYSFGTAVMWGQLVFMSDSTFFDQIAVLPQSITVFLRRKFLINLGITICAGIIAATVDLIFLGGRFFPLILALSIYNGGITTFLVLYRSTLHRQRFEIDASAWFNYQGSSFSFMDILLFLFTLCVPAMFFAFKLFRLSMYLNPLLIVTGGISLLCYMRWMAFIESSFVKRRYVMMEGFRAR